MSHDELRTIARNPDGTRKWMDTGRQVRANRPGAACVSAVVAASTSLALRTGQHLDESMM